MIIKRTFQNRNYLIFNGLRGFIGGGGGENGQSIMWCKRSKSQKEKILEPTEKISEKKKNYIYVRVYVKLYI